MLVVMENHATQAQIDRVVKVIELPQGFRLLADIVTQQVICCRQA